MIGNLVAAVFLAWCARGERRDGHPGWAGFMFAGAGMFAAYAALAAGS